MLKVEIGLKKAIGRGVWYAGIFYVGFLARLIPEVIHQYFPAGWDAVAYLETVENWNWKTVRRWFPTLLPLYLMRALKKLAGMPAVDAVKLFPPLVQGLTCIGVYMVGCRVSDRRSAVYGSILAALSPFSLEISNGYIRNMFGCMILLYSLYIISHRGRTTGISVPLLFLIVFLSHQLAAAYYGLFVLTYYSILLITRRVRREEILMLALSAFLMGVGGYIAYPHIAWYIKAYNEAALLRIRTSVSEWSITLENIPEYILTYLPIIAPLSILSLKKLEAERSLPLYTFIAVGFMLSLTSEYGIHLISVRFLFMLSYGLAVMAGAGLSWMEDALSRVDRFKILNITVVLLTLTLYHGYLPKVRPVVSREEIEAARYVGMHCRQNTTAAVSPWLIAVTYYYRHDAKLYVWTDKPENVALVSELKWPSCIILDSRIKYLMRTGVLKLPEGHSTVFIAGTTSVVVGG